MNGFTTTETDATDTGREVVCERLRMAMAEAGVPCDVQIWINGLPAYWPVDRSEAGLEFRLRTWVKAKDLVGVARRCLPCVLAEPNSSPRVSPDCEGTGRCGVES